MADTIKNWESMRQALQLSGAELRELAQHFRKDAEDALAGKPSSLSALRTYLGLPTGREMGTFLALDFGGYQCPGFAHPPYGRTGLCRRE